MRFRETGRRETDDYMTIVRCQQLGLERLTVDYGIMGRTHGRIEKSQQIEYHTNSCSSLCSSVLVLDFLILCVLMFWQQVSMERCSDTSTKKKALYKSREVRTGGQNTQKVHCVTYYYCLETKTFQSDKV